MAPLTSVLAACVLGTLCVAALDTPNHVTHLSQAEPRPIHSASDGSAHTHTKRSPRKLSAQVEDIDPRVSIFPDFNPEAGAGLQDNDPDYGSRLLSPNRFVDGEDVDRDISLRIADLRGTFESNRPRTVDLALAPLEQTLARSQQFQRAVREMHGKQKRVVTKRPFSPWAGRKRSSISAQSSPGLDDADEETPAAVKLHSKPSDPWKERNSKRLQSNTRGHFQVWAGKRFERLWKDAELMSGNSVPKLTLTPHLSGKMESFPSVNLSKRPAFGPWSGKRGSIQAAGLSKRQVFGAWSGKRSEFHADTLPFFNLAKNFGAPENPWGVFSKNVITPMDMSENIAVSSLLHEPPNAAPADYIDKVRMRNHNSPVKEGHNIDTDFQNSLLAPENLDDLNMEQLVRLYRFYNSQISRNQVNEEEKGRDENNKPDKRGEFGAWAGKRKRNLLERSSPEGKISVLDDIHARQESLHAMLTSRERHIVVQALKLLYKSLLNRMTSSGKGGKEANEGRYENEGQEENFKIKSFEEKDEKVQGEIDQGDNHSGEATDGDRLLKMFASPYRKRPAFHSWAGKRSAQLLNIRQKRSSDNSQSSAHDSLSPVSSPSKVGVSYKANNSPETAGTSSSDKISTDTSAKSSGVSKSGEVEQDYSIKEKRGMGFHAWSGKRADIETDNDIKNEEKPGTQTPKEVDESDEQPGDQDNVKQTEDSLEPHDGPVEEISDQLFMDVQFSDNEPDQLTKEHDFQDVLSSTKSKVGNDKPLPKRSQFHSWSGKRDAELNQPGHSETAKLGSQKENSLQSPTQTLNNKHITEGLEKRDSNSFHSWSGKRNDIPQNRQVITTGAGNAAQMVEMNDLPYHKLTDVGSNLKAAVPNIPAAQFNFQGMQELDKRPAFQAWSGKRSGPVLISEHYHGNKVPLFLPVNRQKQHYYQQQMSLQPQYLVSAPHLSPNPYTNVLYHSAVYPRPMSGVNSPDSEPAINEEFHATKSSNILTENYPDNKRSAFHAWSGKRKRGGEGELNVFPFSAFKRPAFHAWSGRRKRGEQGGDPHVSPYSAAKRPAFQAWSGRRKKGGDASDVQAFNKRPAFHAWSGKKRHSGENRKLQQSYALSHQTWPPLHSWQRDRPYAAGVVLPDFSPSALWSRNFRTNMAAPAVIFPQVSSRMRSPAYSGYATAHASSYLPSASGPHKGTRQHSFPWMVLGQPTVFGSPSSTYSKRQGFHAWSGRKRSSDLSLAQTLEPAAQHNPAWRPEASSSTAKRPAFQAWSGKRSQDMQDFLLSRSNLRLNFGSGTQRIE